MTWHGQINRTIWEIEDALEKKPGDFRLRRELLRTHFLQRYEFDRSLHIPRDDRSFLFLQDDHANAVVLLHGANGTPAEMRDLGNYLYGKGLTVYCPRFSRYDLKKRLVTWESWVTMASGAVETVLKYSPRTTVVGLSMGGTVALMLERLHPIKAMVLLAPALYPRLGLRGRLSSLVRWIAPRLFYRFAGWDGEVAKAMDHVRGTGGTVKVPVLVLQAKDDHVISGRGLKLLRKWLTDERSEVALLPEGAHALTRGPARETVFERVLGFSRAIHPAPGRSGGPRREGATRRTGSESGRDPGVAMDRDRGSRDGGRRRSRRGRRSSRGRRGGGRPENGATGSGRRAGDSGKGGRPGAPERNQSSM